MHSEHDKEVRGWLGVASRIFSGLSLMPACAQVVAVANDITYSSGSFGPKEDAVFRAATEYALEERLPLLYLAANSGARVGLANEIKQSLKVSIPAPELAMDATADSCN